MFNGRDQQGMAARAVSNVAMNRRQPRDLLLVCVLGAAVEICLRVSMTCLLK
jgi:hypothetical protein